VPLQDQEDHLHDMLVEMEKVKRKYEAKGKPLTEAAGSQGMSYWDTGTGCPRYGLSPRQTAPSPPFSSRMTIKERRQP
jgi:hypothetical protein